MWRGRGLVKANWTFRCCAIDRDEVGGRKSEELTSEEHAFVEDNSIEEYRSSNSKMCAGTQNRHGQRRDSYRHMHDGKPGKRSKRSRS